MSGGGSGGSECVGGSTEGRLCLRCRLCSILIPRMLRVVVRIVGGGTGSSSNGGTLNRAGVDAARTACTGCGQCSCTVVGVVVAVVSEVVVVVKVVLTLRYYGRLRWGGSGHGG